MATIRTVIPLDPACPDEQYVRLWISGKLVEIKRNVQVDIPEEYLKIIQENQKETSELSQDDMHISNDDSVRTFI